MRLREAIMTKHIFVTGGVVSALGKGITAASLGRLLKSRGYDFVIIENLAQFCDIFSVSIV